MYKKVEMFNFVAIILWYNLVVDRYANLGKNLSFWSDYSNFEFQSLIFSCQIRTFLTHSSGSEHLKRNTEQIIRLANKI